MREIQEASVTPLTKKTAAIANHAVRCLVCRLNTIDMTMLMEWSAGYATHSRANRNTPVVESVGTECASCGQRALKSRLVMTGNVGLRPVEEVNAGVIGLGD